MNRLMKRLLVCGFACSLGFVAQSYPVHATGAYTPIKTKIYKNIPYHWNGQSSHAYLWNANLTKRRHRLAHWPVTTWYVSKSQEMTNGYKTGIFYKVTDSKNSMSGYVWKNYLSKGALAKGAYPAGLINTKLDQSIVDLFPGTIPNNRLQQAAEYYIKAIESMEPADSFYDYLTETFNANEQKQIFYLVNDPREDSREKKSYRTLTKGQIRFQPYEKKWLQSALADKKKTFNSFRGWEIGAYAFPHSSLYYGMIIIVMLPSQAN